MCVCIITLKINTNAWNCFGKLITHTRACRCMHTQNAIKGYNFWLFMMESLKTETLAMIESEFFTVE